MIPETVSPRPSLCSQGYCQGPAAPSLFKFISFFLIKDFIFMIFCMRKLPEIKYQKAYQKVCNPRSLPILSTRPKAASFYPPSDVLYVLLCICSDHD